jgi:hypothetical protein
MTPWGMPMPVTAADHCRRRRPESFRLDGYQYYRFLFRLVDAAIAMILVTYLQHQKGPFVHFIVLDFD